MVWAQEHLISAVYKLAVDGGFGNSTQQAVLEFQAAHGLTADGVVGSATWTALLRYRPARIVWGYRASARRATADAGASATATGTRYAPVPGSASRPARRDEIPGSLGAGRP